MITLVCNITADAINKTKHIKIAMIIFSSSLVIVRILLYTIFIKIITIDGSYLK